MAQNCQQHSLIYGASRAKYIQDDSKLTLRQFDHINIHIREKSKTQKYFD